MRRLIVLAWLQGIYFAATGVWALVDIGSFQLVTGPKTDLWLVRTVGVLVLAIGGALMVAAARLRVSFELALLAVGSSLGLAAIDVVYATSDIIRDVYLLDAAAEVVLVALWAWAAWRSRDEPALWGREGAEPIGEGMYLNRRQGPRLPGRPRG